MLVRERSYHKATKILVIDHGELGPHGTLFHQQVMRPHNV